MKKKLTKRARKKEATMIQNEARKAEIKVVWKHVKQLEKVCTKMWNIIFGKTSDWRDFK